jgi:hypothetical protein
MTDELSELLLAVALTDIMRLVDDIYDRAGPSRADIELAEHYQQGFRIIPLAAVDAAGRGGRAS